MSKVDIKRLDSLSHNDVAATKNINDNFQALQKAVEDSLSRTGKTPNYMEANLDMNGRRIINGGEPVEGSDFITLNFFKDKIGEVEDVISSVADAKKAAQLASGYAATAVNAKNEAAATAKEVKEYVDDAQNSAAECRAIYEEIKNTNTSGDTRRVYENIEVRGSDFNQVIFPGDVYPYQYTISLETVESTDDPLKDLFPTVVFADAQASSGNFSSVAETLIIHDTDHIVPTLSVRIRSKEDVTEPFTIPTIKLD